MAKEFPHIPGVTQENYFEVVKDTLSGRDIIIQADASTPGAILDTVVEMDPNLLPTDTIYKIDDGGKVIIMDQSGNTLDGLLATDIPDSSNTPADNFGETHVTGYINNNKIDQHIITNAVQPDKSLTFPMKPPVTFRRPAVKPQIP